MKPEATPSLPWSRRTDWKTRAEDIVACFHLLLGRNPNPEEIGHFSRVGVELDAVVGTFVNSYEFSLRGLMRKSYGDDLQVAQWDGFRMFASPKDADVGVNVLAGSYEPHVAAVFRARLRPGMAVLDIGANIGFFTMLAAALVGAQGRVFAAEPNPDNARMIEASRRLNGFGQAEVWQLAAGREPGMLMLNATFTNGTTGNLPAEAAAVLSARTVMVAPLDALLPAGRRIDLIKIDVEGSEAAALQGLRRCLERDHPLILSEFSPALLEGFSGVSGPDYLRFLTGLGYRLQVLHGDLGMTDCGQDVERVMACYAESGVDHIDLLAE